jgi:hypothetical protein
MGKLLVGSSTGVCVGLSIGVTKGALVGLLVPLGDRVGIATGWLVDGASSLLTQDAVDASSFMDNLLIGPKVLQVGHSD